MSVKHYCDGCGCEITRNFVSERFKPQLKMKNPIALEIKVCISGTWNGGDLCSICLFKVLNEGKEFSIDD